MKLFWDSANWQSLCKRCHDSFNSPAPIGTQAPSSTWVWLAAPRLKRRQAADRRTRPKSARAPTAVSLKALLVVRSLVLRVDAAVEEALRQHLIDARAGSDFAA